MSAFNPPTNLPEAKTKFPQNRNQFSPQEKIRYPPNGNQWHGKNPITSYGIIAFVRNAESLKILLYQRRDTFEYMDFLRGLWSSSNREAVDILFSNMTIAERDRLSNYSFDELWDDLWVSHECKIYSQNKRRSQQKYESIVDTIPDILERTFSNKLEPSWGFPKGKKNRNNEGDADCAIREFCEETHFQPTDLRLLNTKSLVEYFRGTDGKNYKTHYFIAEAAEEIHPARVATPHCIRKDTISEEARDVQWFSVDDALVRLPDKRKSILRKAIKFINRERSEST